MRMVFWIQSNVGQRSRDVYHEVGLTYPISDLERKLPVDLVHHTGTADLIRSCSSCFHLYLLDLPRGWRGFHHRMSPPIREVARRCFQESLCPQNHVHHLTLDGAK